MIARLDLKPHPEGGHFHETFEWTLCGCTVAPGFEFTGFELVPPDWEPG